MIIYQDVFSNDELMSDSFPMEDVDDIVYKVTCHMINQQGFKVDIGANPSAEGGDDEEKDAGGDGCIGGGVVNDVLDAFKLQPTSFDKKSYLVYIKEYMKRLKDYLAANKPNKVEKFQSSAQAFVKKIVENFKDYEFYVGESMDPEAMVVIMGYEANGITPYVYLFKDGLKETKV